MVIDEVRRLFGEMETILESEGERNWIRGVRLISNTLSVENPESADSQLEEAKQTYKSMHGGAGSFSDYYIHRADFNERLEANKRLDEIRERLWRVLFG